MYDFSARKVYNNIRMFLNHIRMAQQSLAIAKNNKITQYETDYF